MTPRLPSLQILMFGLNYAPELTGIGKYTGEMAGWLSARGHRVHVVTAPPYYPAWRISEAYRGRGYSVEGGGPRGDGVGEPLVFRCPLYVPESVTGIRRILHLISFAVSGTPVMLRQAFSSPDLVWTVEPTFFCSPTALLAGLLAGAPTWLHVQDLEVQAAFDLELLPAKGVLQRFATYLEGLFTRAFSRVSSISAPMMEQVVSKGVPEKRALLFPNWVDVDRVQPQSADTPNPLRRELGLDGKVVFLYAGNFGNKQGLELLSPLASAFLHDAHVHFVFCGDGTYRRILEEDVRSLPNVTMLPLQPLDRLNDLLNLADIHLLPQRSNVADLVMPSKLTGMLASGRPVLATADQNTQVASVIGGSASHDPCGLVVPSGDLDRLVSAAAILAEDAGMRSAMGAAARTYAVNKLGREQVMLQFEEDLYAAVRAFRGVTSMGDNAKRTLETR